MYRTFSKQYRDTLLVMINKDIALRFKHTVLGLAWLILIPLFQLGVLFLVSSYIFHPENPYEQSLFLMAGIFPWNFFSNSLNQGVYSLIQERNLIKKMPLRIEIILLAKIFSNFISAFILLIPLVIITALLNRIGLSGFLVLSFAILLETFFTIGLVFILSIVYIFFQDIAFVLQTVLTLWFYVTPVMYNYSIIPNKFFIIYSLNPMASVVTMFQVALGYGKVIPVNIVYFHFILSVFIFLIGILILRKVGPVITDFL